MQICLLLHKLLFYLILSGIALGIFCCKGTDLTWLFDLTWWLDWTGLTDWLKEVYEIKDLNNPNEK